MRNLQTMCGCTTVYHRLGIDLTIILEVALALALARRIDFSTRVRVRWHKVDTSKPLFSPSLLSLEKLEIEHPLIIQEMRRVHFLQIITDVKRFEKSRCVSPPTASRAPNKCQ